ncbi:hypothetical protein BJY00DRAFT_54065 [Aspergillus carlsbadensis]|nr:hypothetical protein BJY00DRAFT_54065 [Aspergillus carlsbadensis]
MFPLVYGKTHAQPPTQLVTTGHCQAGQHRDYARKARVSWRVMARRGPTGPFLLVCSSRTTDNIQNEHIRATGLYYCHSTNITKRRLSFRQESSFIHNYSPHETRP